jgi:peroxiredoxin
MKAYQADIAKFEATGTQVIGISVDSGPANAHWAKELGVTFPILSDFKRVVVKDYGVYNEAQGYASRATFMVDKEGIIRHIEQGSTAIDPSGAYQACSLAEKKK